MVYFWSIHFVKTVPSGSVKLSANLLLITDVWPIKPISDYEQIIGASLVSIAIGILVACAAVFVMANCKLAWYKIESHIRWSFD